MGDTKIEWTEKTWNPVRGCSVVSEGCRNCYAMNFATRFAGKGEVYEGLAYRNQSGAHWTGKLQFVGEHLEDPLRWKTPQMIFVNSMSDLFHESVETQWLNDIFGIMALAHWHTFQVLTKRPQRALEYLSQGDHGILSQFQQIQQCGGIGPRRMFRALDIKRRDGIGWKWPLPNVWLGVSVEDQKTADERIPLLLQTPAAVRWISAEPLLGPVDLDSSIGTYDCMNCRYRGFDADAVTKAESVDGDEKCPKCGAVLEFGMAENNPNLTSLDWVVVGGESGPNAREFDVAWARSIIQQCRAANVSVFIKQLGAQVTVPHSNGVNVTSAKLRNKKGGDMSEWPEDLRIREFPTTFSTGISAEV